MPCSPSSFNRRFGGIYRLHLQGRRNKFTKNQQASRWQTESYIMFSILRTHLTLLTAWSRVHLEKTITVPIVKRLSVYYCNRKFISVIKTARQLNPVYSLSQGPVLSYISTNILYSFLFLYNACYIPHLCHLWFDNFASVWWRESPISSITWKVLYLIVSLLAQPSKSSCAYEKSILSLAI
jgi:hypothetical protein